MFSQDFGKIIAALIFWALVIAVIFNPGFIGIIFCGAIIAGLFGAVLKVAGWGMRQ